MVRLKHRYLLTELVFEDGKVDTGLTPGVIGRAVKDAVAMVHGDYGLSCLLSSFQVKYMNPMTSIALFKASRDHYELLWSAMTLMTTINRRECALRVVHLGGTIRSCQEALLRHNRVQLSVMAKQAATPAERAKIEALILSDVGVT